MTSKPKTPTAPGVSALLRKAGHEKSVSSPSRIKGWRNHSEGYVVATWIDEGSVSVRHVTSSFRPLDSELDRIARRLDEYATAIEAAGFAVERRTDRLVVTAQATAETKET